MSAVELHGFCHPRFRALEDMLRANFADGLELGASLSLTWRGETVVDLWGGWADAEETRPWAQDSVTLVASSSKVAVILCLLMLIDRGRIDLDAPVAAYWPEFAQGGKAAVTVREAMSHQGGVPSFDPPVKRSLFYDWEATVAALAATPHWFEGRPTLCYHAGTFGFLLGEIVRRTDGRSLRTFFQEEVAAPARVDFQFGLTDLPRDLPRYAALRMPTERQPPATPLAARILAAVTVDDPGGLPYITAEMPSENGITNGRAMARMSAIFALNGELDGRRYLSPEIIAEAGREHVYAEDARMGWMRMGLGLGLDSPEFPAPSPTTLHWGGFGGSFTMMDPVTQVSLGYVPSNWIAAGYGAVMEPRQERLYETMRDLLAGL